MRQPTDDPPPSESGRPIEERSDRSLLRRLRRGEDDAATALYVRYAQRLVALTRTQAAPELTRQVEADDIVQSVFLSFFRKAAGGMYDVPEGEELWQLLLVITLNKIRAKGNYFRAAKRDFRLQAPGDAADEFGAAQQPDEMALTELQMVIQEILATLPPRTAQIVELRIAGHEVTEIARLSQRSMRTVERALQEFRQQLSSVLNEEK